jgi:hypothetical protein
MVKQTNSKDNKQPYQTTRARCGQCGRELRYVPFSLNNIMCRECYGLDRYRRSTPSSWVPEKAIESTVTDEEAGSSSL